MNTNLTIVYFVWINDQKNWREIIRGQLQSMKDSGIFSEAKIFVVVSCQDIDLIVNVKISLLNIMGLVGIRNYELDVYNSNLYEYYGIKKLYDLSLISPTTIFLYIHAKGMSNTYSNIDTRHNYETALTQGTILEHRNTVDLFNSHPEIMLCGLFPADHHKRKFIWFNFFWCRATYIKTCENPIISNNRYYYETWLETGSTLPNSIFNIHEMNYNKYTLKQAAEILNFLDGKYQRGILPPVFFTD